MGGAAAGEAAVVADEVAAVLAEEVADLAVGLAAAECRGLRRRLAARLRLVVLRRGRAEAEAFRAQLAVSGDLAVLVQAELAAQDLLRGHRRGSRRDRGRAQLTSPAGDRAVRDRVSRRGHVRRLAPVAPESVNCRPAALVVGRVLVQEAESVNCRQVPVAELVARAAGRANCRLAQVEESPAALVDDRVALVKDLESANCPRVGPAEARWREGSAAARLCYQAWVTAQATLEIGRANFRIERRRSGATICKTVSLRRIGVIDSTTVRTAAMTGKIGIRTFMTATKIGITDAGAITAIGGAICGVTTPR
jgi:hypothetical protein